MRDYEALCILKPDLEEAAVKELYKKVAEHIQKYNGEIQAVEECGKKKLAYKLGKHREGIYYLVRFKIAPAQIKELNRDFKLNESLLRTLVTQRTQ